MNRSLVFVLAALVVGCSDPEPTGDAEVATFEETTFSDDAAESDVLTVRAVFRGTIYEGEAVMVDHEEIPDLMPAMRMPFTLERPNLAAGLSEGDKVLLTLREYETGPGLMVTAIEPLPADVELNLEGAVSDSTFVPGVE